MSWGTSNLTGKRRRLTRLATEADGRFLFVPLDHSVSDGPIAHAEEFALLVGRVAHAGADAVVVHKGRARHLRPEALGRAGLIIHLSAGTRLAEDGNAKVLVGSVAEAVCLGADAVSVHVNLGSDTEAQQLSDLGRVAEACERWQVPLLAMMYPRGPRIADPSDPALLAHAVTLAAELGADIVKTLTPRTQSETSDVVACSPIPVIAAGGPASATLPSEFARVAMAAGCSGLAIGRRVFGAPAVEPVIRDLAAIVHGREAELDHEAPRVRAGVLA